MCNMFINALFSFPENHQYTVPTHMSLNEDERESITINQPFNSDRVHARDLATSTDELASINI